jgi:hypothetical protein
MVAVLPVAGLNTRPVDADRVLKLLPFMLPCTLRVWVRVPHAMAGGSFRITWSTFTVAPRSICTQDGSALSQYVWALPSFTFDAGYPPIAPEAATGLPGERLGPPAACAGVADRTDAARPAARNPLISRRDGGRLMVPSVLAQ